MNVMMSSLLPRLLFGILGLAMLPAGAWAADSAHGAVVARVRCMTCHFLDRAERKIGPGLLDVYDRAPTISGVPFARWDAKALNIWLSGPRKVKANTTMMLPPLSPRDRQDVIAYLKQQRHRLTAGASVSPAVP